WLGLVVFPDTLGKGIQLKRKFVNGREFLLKPFACDLSCESPLFFKGKRRRKRRPAFLTVHLNERGQSRSPTGSPLQYQSTLKIQPEGNALFDFLETFAVMAPLISGSLNRIFINQPSRGIHTVNADVHQGTAATQFGLEKPVRG